MPSEDRPGSSEQPTAPRLPRLERREQILYEALREHSPTLAVKYHAALAVLAERHLPERLVAAAHFIRELMEKLARVFGLAKPGEGIPRPDVWALEPSWTAVEAMKSDGRWIGEITDVLRGFLNSFGDYFERYKEYAPKRRVQVDRLLQKLDASDVRIPRPLADLRVIEWRHLEKYFTDVAHYQSAPSEEDFRSWVTALETFLLDRLRPRTCADLEEIDRLRAEGESHAES